MINVWKPLHGPLRDWPLALCDLRSIDPDDLQRLDEVHSEDFLESYQVKYNSAQRWWFLPEQEPHEILVFKGADSEVSGAVPHGSFPDPSYSDRERKRESVECRILVVY